MRNRLTSTLLSLTVCLALGSTTAWAGTLTGVTSLAALGANDFADWGQLGPNSTTVTTPTPWTSNLGGVGLVGLIGGADALRLDQGIGWNGNFTNGDHLLWNQGSNQNIGVEFLSTLYSSVGANIQADSFGPYTATITAFDSSFNVIGTFSEPGTASSAGDGSAIFIGIKDTNKEIAAVSFTVSDSNGNNDYAINTLHLNSADAPEPGSLALLAVMGIPGARLILRRRK